MYHKFLGLIGCFCCLAWVVDPIVGGETLLSWLGGNRSTTDSPRDDAPIEADRPDFTEADVNVGKGRIQLEAGYTFLADRGDGSKHHHHSWPEALLRIGLFADWFELRIGQNCGNDRETFGLTRASTSGIEDLYLGVGLQLTEQQGLLPRSRIMPQMRLPTGSGELNQQEVLPGVNYCYGWEIIEDLLGIHGNTKVNRARDTTGVFYAEFAQSMAMDLEWTQRLSGYVEYFGLYPSGATSSDTGPEHYFDGGFIFRLSNHFQVDVRAGVGLNRNADDFFTGAGLVYRY